MATVELKQLRKAFDSVEIVHGVDLAIADREVTRMRDFCRLASERT